MTGVGAFGAAVLLIVGALVDLFLFNATGWATIVVAGLALLFYLFALILSIAQLKTEKKAQARAYALLKENEMATDE